ncbi:hypothetical protein HG531_007343 [Fusarium graminearum]|nr:hypothetical protein HG531_007343 [Fusarium graminearum]
MRLDDQRFANTIVLLNPLVERCAACETGKVGPSGVGRNMAFASRVGKGSGVGGSGRGTGTLVRQLKRVMTSSVASILVDVVMVDDTVDQFILAQVALLLSLVEEHLLVVVARNK